MQLQKENIRTGIIEKARSEFFTKGFKGASMREIAQYAGIAVGNVYNYFPSKDSLLKEVLSPLVAQLDSMFEEHEDPEIHLRLEVFSSLEYQKETAKQLITLTTHYREELNLLIFKSYGSSYQDLCERYVERYTKSGILYMQSMNEKFPHLHTDISEFFIHSMGAQMFAIIGEIVSHELSLPEIEQFINEYVCFSTAGWKMLMKV